MTVLTLNGDANSLHSGYKKAAAEYFNGLR